MNHNKALAHPTALSAKLRTYFLWFMRSRTTSATDLIDPTRSDTYGDRPLTFSTFDHEVEITVVRAGSHANSSSLKTVMRQAEITLKSSPVLVKRRQEINRVGYARLPKKQISFRLEGNLITIFRIYRRSQLLFELYVVSSCELAAPQGVGKRRPT
jgi:hypothetical protein